MTTARPRPIPPAPDAYGGGVRCRFLPRRRSPSMTARPGTVGHAPAFGFCPAPTKGRCTSHKGRRHQHVGHRLARHVDSTNRPPPHQDVASGPRGQIRAVEERRRREGEGRKQVVRSQRNVEAVQIQRTGRRDHRRHGMKHRGRGHGGQFRRVRVHTENHRAVGEGGQPSSVSQSWTRCPVRHS